MQSCFAFQSMFYIGTVGESTYELCFGYPLRSLYPPLTHTHTHTHTHIYIYQNYILNDCRHVCLTQLLSGETFKVLLDHLYDFISLMVEK